MFDSVLNTPLKAKIQRYIVKFIEIPNLILFQILLFLLYLIKLVNGLIMYSQKSKRVKCQADFSSNITSFQPRIPPSNLS